MTDDQLPSRPRGSWWARYTRQLGQGLTPEAAADATHRAGRTFAQGAVAVLVTAGALSVDVWAAAFTAGTMAVLSFGQRALGK